MRNKLIYITVIGLSISCGVSKKEIKEASNSICECFESYRDNSRDEMEYTISCLDSLKQIGIVESIPENKLYKQLEKDCPTSKELLIELTK